MAIPDYQSLMLPVLQFMSDRREHDLHQLSAALARQFSLGEDELQELIPSGGQTKFDNRVVWARTYLKKAGLLDSPGRGRWQITQRGLEVLAARPDRIDTRFLSQYPEFRQFSARPEPSTQVTVNTLAQDSVLTPVELLEASYVSLRQELANDLINRVKTCSPKFFERLVVDLLVAMGYGGSRRDAGEAVGKSGDGGIDGIIKEDRLGLDAVYVQAKRWEATVGRPVVQGFAGSLMGHRASKGVLITTSQFSQEARDYAGSLQQKVVLIDGEHLVQYLIDNGVGVTDVSNYVVKRMDSDYFDEEA